MTQDISRILADWGYVPSKLSVRKIVGSDGTLKIQVRMDLGLMQLAWSGRPDATRPHGCDSLLDYYQHERRRREQGSPQTSFSLSGEACADLSQEAAKFYWRRVSFFELKEYQRAEQDALHNLAILGLCHDCAEAEEDRLMAEHHVPFVTAHLFQARALRRLEQKDYVGTVAQIQAGIEEIERFLREIGSLERLEDCPELRFLRGWREEVEESRPLTLREQLRADLRSAVESDCFEVAAALRDRLRQLDE